MTTAKEKIEKQLQDIIGGGWESLAEGNVGEVADLAYEQQLKQYQHAAALVSGINADALAILQDIIKLPPTWKVDELGLINAIGYGIFREGQVSIMRYIEQCQEIVAAGPPEGPTDNTQTNEET